MARALQNRLTHLLSSRRSSPQRCCSLHGTGVSQRFWNLLNLENSQRNNGAKCDAATKADCSLSKPRMMLLSGTSSKPSVGELLSKWCCQLNDKLDAEQAAQFPYYRQRAPRLPRTPCSQPPFCPSAPCPAKHCDPCSLRFNTFKCSKPKSCPPASPYPVNPCEQCPRKPTCPPFKPSPPNSCPPCPTKPKTDPAGPCTPLPKSTSSAIPMAMMFHRPLTNRPKYHGSIVSNMPITKQHISRKFNCKKHLTKSPKRARLKPPCSRAACRSAPKTSFRQVAAGAPLNNQNKLIQVASLIKRKARLPRKTL